MVTTLEIQVDGLTVRAYDTAGPGEDDRLPVLWHHGTPNLGLPPAPLFAEADALGLRWLSYDRPGYGGSTRAVGRGVGYSARIATALADALDIDELAVAGHSGGATHALACAALLPDRVVAAVSIAGLAPVDAAGLDWFAGMIPSGVAALRAAQGGLEVKTAHEGSGVEYDPEFTPQDLAELDGAWEWLGTVANAASGDVDGLIDDDLAYVTPWGFEPTALDAPVLLVQGGKDGIVPDTHARWLAAHLPHAELWWDPDDGHVSVLRHAKAALAWLRVTADRT